MPAKVFPDVPSVHPRRLSLLGVFFGGASSCPRCGSAKVSRSRRHGALEWFLKWIALPYRCLECKVRFFTFR
jgi:DNA-directed RNA polymerase subunit RPC12/RpoP